jgi:hypothetical protein
MTQPLLLFSYLQVLDLMTTVAFLLLGVREANPVVKFAFSLGNPISGLLLVKVIAIGLGVYCWYMGRERLLFRMNVMFALLVAWNLVAVIMGSAAHAR